MKSKVLFSTFPIMLFLGGLTVPVKSQIKSNELIYSKAISEGKYYKCNSGYITKDTTLIADETNLTYLKTGAKLVTYSEAVFKDVSLKFGDKFKSIHIYYKNDRHGGYKEYVIYLSTQLADEIKGWAKKNL